MIFIQKNHEPPGLKRYKAEKRKSGEEPSYKDFSEEEANKVAFEELRESLVKEQRFICCYCQQRIAFKNEFGSLMMKTEHFEPKGGPNAVPKKQLDYGNLLAACLGNKDTDQDKHCDVSKGYKPLRSIPNPSAGKRKDFRPFLKYDVRVKQKQVVVLPKEENEQLKHEIDHILNLNEQSLRSKRFAVWESVWKLVSKKDKALDERRLKEILELYEPTPKKINYWPFCEFISSWLKEHDYS